MTSIKDIQVLTNFGQQIVDSKENHENGCQQRSDFMAKMHQIRFWLGLRPRLSWRILQRSLIGFKGPVLLMEGRGGNGG